MPTPTAIQKPKPMPTPMPTPMSDASAPRAGLAAWGADWVRVAGARSRALG